MFHLGSFRDELARQLSLKGTPVRAFIEDRFGGPPMFEMERNAAIFRKPPWLIVPPGDSDQTVIRDAADWMLRFLVTPTPDLSTAHAGAANCRVADMPVADAVAALGSLVNPGADALLLARACWAFALVAQAQHMDKAAIRRGPLSVLRGASPSADDLLGLAPPDALVQLAMFHHIYATRLLPSLGSGIDCAPPVAGPRLAQRQLEVRPALIAGGRMIEVTCVAKWVPLRRAEVFRLIAGALLDGGDEFGISAVAVFNVRFADCQSWGLQWLLDELAGERVSVPDLRAEFRGIAGCLS